MNLFIYAAQVFIRNTTNLSFELIQSTIESIHLGELIQLPLPYLPSSSVYTHPIELGVGSLGS